MPYKSEAQRKYFNVNRKKLEAQGVDVDEWNQASRGKKLPEKKANTPGQTGNIPVTPPTQVRPTAAPSSYVPRPARRQTSLADGQGYKGASVQNTGTPFFYLLAKAAAAQVKQSNDALTPFPIPETSSPADAPWPPLTRTELNFDPAALGAPSSSQQPVPFKGGPGLEGLGRFPAAKPSLLSQLGQFAQSPAGIATGIGLGGLGAGMYLGSRRRKDDDDDEKVASSGIVKALSTLLSLGMGAAGGAGATHYVHSKLNQDNLNQAKNKIETLNGLLENAYVTSEDRRKSYHDLLDEYNKARDFWKEDTQVILLERLKAIKNELNNINGIYGDAQKVTDVSDNQFDIPKVTPNKTSGPNNLYSRFSSFIKTPTGMATGVGLGLGGLGLGMYMLNKQQKSKSNKNDNDVKLLAKKAANDTLDKVMQYGGIPLALTAGGAALGTGLGALHHPIAEAFSDDDDPDARHQRLKDRLSSGAIGGSGVGMGIALSQLLRGAAKK